MNSTKPSAPELIYADWPAPDNIVALVTCRANGESKAPYNGLNLAKHVGDSEIDVEQNRQLLIQHCSGLDSIQWLNQVHGIEVVAAADSELVLEADASFSQQAGLACAILTADCLPIVVCDRQGLQIAAIHAGWRGLAAGIIEQTCGRFSAPSSELLVWFGPAISQPNYEVGSDVLQAFLAGVATELRKEINAAFLPNTDKPGHYFVDLYQIARIKFRYLGVTALYGGQLCSYADGERFYSYRRDGVTGRMATLIYKKSSSNVR